MPPKKNLTEFRVKPFNPNDLPISAGMLLVAPPGSGKCLAKGTRVLSFKGKPLNVEDVLIGDILMGDDLTPRIVVSLVRGTSELFHVVPQERCFDGYVANVDHQVTCLDAKGQVIDPTIGELKSRGTEGLQLFSIRVPTLGRVPVNYIETFDSIEKAEEAERAYRASGYPCFVSSEDGLKVQMMCPPHPEPPPTVIKTTFKVESVGLGEYYGFSLARVGDSQGESDHRFLLADLVVTHNSSFIEELMFRRKHSYPVCKLYIGNVDGYERAKKIYPPLFIEKEFSEEDLKRFIQRQERQIQTYPKGALERRAALVIDDAGGESIFRNVTVQNVAKIGSQHWDLFALFATQYAVDFPPAFREAISYVAVGKMFSPGGRKNIFNIVGGLVGSKKAFEDLMDKTGNHVFIIFSRRSSTDEIEDVVSWHRTAKMEDNPKWSFGCIEYREYGKQRYNPEYVDSIFV